VADAVGDVELEAQLEGEGEGEGEGVPLAEGQPLAVRVGESVLVAEEVRGALCEMVVLCVAEEEGVEEEEAHAVGARDAEVQCEVLGETRGVRVRDEEMEEVGLNEGDMETDTEVVGEPVEGPVSLRSTPARASSANREPLTHCVPAPCTHAMPRGDCHSVCGP
jgi:hypothetical protein